MVVIATIVTAFALTTFGTLEQLYPNRAVRTHHVMYETASAEQKTLSLPDGSSLVLGALSKVTLDWTRERRAVALAQGEAFFRVAPDPGRPFVVVAGGGLIRALGTEFNVLRDAQRVVVTVSEDPVLVSSSDSEVLPLPQARSNTPSFRHPWRPTALNPASKSPGKTVVQPPLHPRIRRSRPPGPRGDCSTYGNP